MVHRYVEIEEREWKYKIVYKIFVTINYDLFYNF